MAAESAGQIAPLVTLAVASLAAVVGAGAKWYFDGRMARQKNAFDLHKELHSKEMGDTRSDVWEFLRKNPTLRIGQLHKEDIFPDDAKKVWLLVQFFHRVAAAWKLGYISRSMFIELFGEIMVWWYLVMIRRGLEPMAFQSEQIIREAYESLERHSRDEPRFKVTWDAWRARAMEDAARAGIDLQDHLADKCRRKRANG